MVLLLSLWVLAWGFWSGAAQSVLQDYRLPGDITPVSYELRLEPDLRSFVFDSELRLKFRVLSPTAAVVLNAKDLRLDLQSLSLFDAHDRAVPVSSVDEDPTLERLLVLAKRPLSVGTQYRLQVKYRGNINDEGVGFYRSSFVDPKSGQTRWFGVTQLRPVHARRVFPCLDEPIFRATFRISILHSPNYKAISNMPPANVQAKGNLTLTTFEETPRIPPFIVGFMVSELGSARSGNSVCYAVPSKVRGAGWAATVSPRLSAAMANHLGLPFPQTKTDIVALPRLVPVAMENWGLFTFREQYSLYFEGVSTTLQRQDVARFIAHEVAHAWMGNTVTIAWWDFLWLSEVFGMYYEYYIPSLIEPSWKMMEQMVYDLHQLGLQDDSVPTDPLTTTVLTPQEITAKFSGVTYSKGPALLRMVIHAVTENEFLKSFRHFLLRNAYSDVVPNDLWNAVDRKDRLPANLSEIMHDWTTVSGYPVVDVVRDYTTGTVTLTQTKFRIDETVEPGEQTWWIPLSYTTSREMNFASTLPKLWFQPQKSQHFQVPLEHSDWILFNIQSTGFYRVNYDERNWANLAKALVRDHSSIHVLSRSGLLDDAFNLARGGRLDYGTALGLAGYLRKERAYVPWLTALRAFNYLDQILFHSPLLPSFRAYVLSLLDNAYGHIGFDQQSSDSHLKKVSRELIVRWACRMGHSDCIMKSLRYASSLQQKASRVSVDVRDTALCTAVAEGTHGEWNLLMSLYASTQSDDERSRYLNALACTKDPSNVQRFLVDTVNELRENEWISRFNAFARNRNNAQPLLDILTQNFETITNKFGDGLFVGFVTQISRFLNTPLQENAIKELESKGLTGLTDVRSGIASRAAWLDRHLTELSNFFNKDTHNTHRYYKK